MRWGGAFVVARHPIVSGVGTAFVVARRPRMISKCNALTMVRVVLNGSEYLTGDTCNRYNLQDISSEG